MSGKGKRPMASNEKKVLIIAAEKVLGKRTLNEKNEYLIKFVGLDETEAKWIPEANLWTCIDQIFIYEDVIRKKLLQERRYRLRKLSKIRRPAPGRSRRNGFERGLTADRVLAAANESGKLTFLMKWKGIRAHEFVAADIVKAHCPKLVIEYYEEQLKWAV